MRTNNWIIYLLLWLILLTACAPAVPAVEQAVANTPVPSPTWTAAPTITPASTHTPVPPTAAPSTTPAPQLCSPLDAVALPDLTAMVSNPYHPPPPGSDDPHHGVDLAVLLPGSRAAVSGHPVAAAYPGRVAGVIRDRFPYGNAVIIETRLDSYPLEWWQAVEVPEVLPTLVPRSALTCPAAYEPTILELEVRSVYILYAHMQQLSDLNIGDPVACGQSLGTIGDSGNALNPHLHVETRTGPGGLQLESMAHYDSSASTAEMASYCLWRISRLFQLVDPMKALRLNP
jgi:murein DD-endopeptidase MepM/ murein hydrolase activator NlpD